MPQASFNRTILQAVVEQAAIGQSDLVLAAAVPGARIHIVTIAITLSAAGTLQFNEGTGPTAITGVMPIAANGGFVIGEGGGFDPVLSTQTPGNKLGIVTTGTGATAHGWIRYFID